ncbi:MAG: four helix bundle protein [Candidatus Paceibacterota bacterium]|jgi:four helix bundle protein
MSSNYISLGELEPYKTSVKISEKCWQIYEKLNWQLKKVIGDQFIRSIDSMGANVAEGYGRFHYLDRIKFYYNARGSLFEAKHWLLLLKKRKIISETQFNDLLTDLESFHKQLNVFIKASYPKE